MPFFEITVSDGTTSVVQGHNKRQVREALEGLVLTKIVQMRRCKRCRRAVATIQGTLCEPCWVAVLAYAHDAWKDFEMDEQGLQDLALSFFVDG